MKAPKFKYVRAESVEQALTLLEKHGDDARILAGGQSLMPTLNMRLSQPEILIDINRLDQLKGLSFENGVVRIGALARHVEIANSDIVTQHLPLISEAMPHVAHVAVRNRGTFGGSIALADPAAEMPACALALSATFVLQSINGRREIAADNYFLGLYETARQPNELLVETLIPAEPEGSISVFLELAQRHGDFAMAGIACHVTIDRDLILSARLVYFGSEDKPTLAQGAVHEITGKRWSEETRNAVITALSDDLDPMSNLQGSAAMKLELQRVLTGRAIDAAFEKARAS